MYLLPNADHMLEAFDDESEENAGALCEEVYVKEEQIDLLSHDCCNVISMWLNGAEVTFSINRNQLTSKALLPVLLRKGFTMLDDPENIKAVLSYVLDSCKGAPKSYVHRRLGFCEVNSSEGNGKTVFLTNGVIGLPDTDEKSKSKYSGEENVVPCGTLESWKAIVEKEVLGHSNMELALAIGVSAPMAFLLQEAGLFTEVPIWGIIGKSSTGKTTALRLMASVFGSPKEGTGLIKDFHATDAAIFSMLQDHGMIHLIDEATLRDRNNFSSMLYGLSKGVDKLRCNGDGNLRQRQRFSGDVIISGERSLLEQSSANLGLYARLVEICLTWTDDAEHARRLSQAVSHNYGWAIVPYVEHLLRLRAKPEEIQKEFAEEYNHLKSVIGDVTGEQERPLNMYATVVLSAKLFSEALGLNLNIQSIRTLLVQIHGKAPKQSDLAQELYQSILDEVALHGAHFPTTSGTNKNQFILSDMWGERTTLKSKNGKPQNVLWIAGPKFQEFAAKHGFENYAQFMDELCNQKKLKRYSDGYTAKHRLGSHSPRCYCLYE